MEGKSATWPAKARKRREPRYLYATYLADADPIVILTFNVLLPFPDRNRSCSCLVKCKFRRDNVEAGGLENLMPRNKGVQVRSSAGSRPEALNFVAKVQRFLTWGISVSAIQCSKWPHYNLLRST